MTDYSPFTPGTPTPIELFVGRNEEIRDIRSYLKNTYVGKQENIFLSGNRGIGKSSLAKYIRILAAREFTFLTLHVHLGSVQSIDEVVFLIFDRLLKEGYTERWFDRISLFFKAHIKQVDLFGVNLSLVMPEQDLKELRLQFPIVLKNLLDRLAPDKKGLLIILDDINGLANTPEFANWYKSMVDHIATHYDHPYPLMLIPTGVPEVRRTLNDHQPSLMRIFRVLSIPLLSSDEVRFFFQSAFDGIHLSLDPGAMDIMVEYTFGYPSAMHEIGDAVLHYDTDDHICVSDARKGVYYASRRIGEKYLDPSIYANLCDPQCISLIHRIGEWLMDHQDLYISSVDLMSDEWERYNKLMNEMVQRKIIHEKGEIGERRDIRYIFTDDLYPLFLKMYSSSSSWN